MVYRRETVGNEPLGRRGIFFFLSLRVFKNGRGQAQGNVFLKGFVFKMNFGAGIYGVVYGTYVEIMEGSGYLECGQDFEFL